MMQDVLAELDLDGLNWLRWMILQDHLGVQFVFFLDVWSYSYLLI